MSEIEAAAADTLGGLFRRRKPAHSRPPGSPCANCGVTLQGPWCHACGQVSDDYHRSVRHLIMEGVEGLLHFDGRLWQTVPRLFFRPGTLTRSYIEGRRAPQISPFRLFLVVILLLFFFAHSSGGALIKMNPGDIKRDAHGAVVAPDVEVHLGSDKPNEAATHWVQQRLKVALASPEHFGLILENWAHRLAVLMLPISAAILGLLFVFQRRFVVFDHLIFSMHSLSFAGLVISLCFLLRPLVGDGVWLLLAALPVHLFLHMRGVYRTGVFGTLLRMFVLLIGSMIGFALVLILLFALGLNDLGGH